MTLETGLSDHHKMTITILKSHFKKNDYYYYYNYKSLDDQKFRNDIIRRLEQFKTLNIDDFESVFMNTHAPMKKKIVRR